MNEKQLTKEKFILQLIAVLIAGGIVFSSFIAIDRYHERYIKVKLAEIGIEHKKESTHE